MVQTRNNKGIDVLPVSRPHKRTFVQSCLQPAFANSDVSNTSNLGPKSQPSTFAKSLVPYELSDSNDDLSPSPKRPTIPFTRSSSPLSSTQNFTESFIGAFENTSIAEPRELPSLPPFKHWQMNCQWKSTMKNLIF